jgi:excisionase family DNA binding protein
MLDVREAAALVHRTPETVRRWVWSGRLPSRKSANRLLVPRREVERLVTPPTTPARLADWLTEASAVLGAGSPGASASDLVLEDRAERSAGR